MSEHEKFETIVALPKHKTHIGLATLHGGIRAASPTSKIMLKIGAVRFRISQRSGDLESGLLQNRGVPIVVVRKESAQGDQIVSNKPRIKEDGRGIKDGGQSGLRLSGRQCGAPRSTSASTSSRMAAVRPAAPGSKCASRAR